MIACIAASFAHSAIFFIFIHWLKLYCDIVIRNEAKLISLYCRLCGLIDIDWNCCVVIQPVSHCCSLLVGCWIIGVNSWNQSWMLAITCCQKATFHCLPTPSTMKYSATQTTHLLRMFYYYTLQLKYMHTHTHTCYVRCFIISDSHLYNKSFIIIICNL